MSLDPSSGHPGAHHVARSFLKIYNRLLSFIAATLRYTPLRELNQSAKSKWA
jgi:hypothetical protein